MEYSRASHEDVEILEALAAKGLVHRHNDESSISDKGRELLSQLKV
jgi:ribosomal protein S19E (S16A)